MLQLSTEVQYVKGIGPQRAQALADKGIATVEDLLYYLPFRYEDRLNPRTLAEVREGEMASLIAEVRGSVLFRTRKMPILQVSFGQGRHVLRGIWFHGTYLKDRFKPGMMVALYGKVERGRGRGELEIKQPQFEVLSELPGLEDDTDAVQAKAAGDASVAATTLESLEIGRIVPIYESADKQRLTSRWFRHVIHRLLENLPAHIEDGIPKAVRERLSLLPRRQAFEHAHFPPPGESFAQLMSAKSPAHVRLIFEELFFLEVGLELKRAKLRSQRGIAFQVNDQVRDAIKRFLPFRPTEAQKRVIKEIATDMQQTAPMRRLLQGDVGSGKTLVALEAAIIAIENGYQVAFMAPTEILATQHYLSARRLLEPLGYRIVLLTGSLEYDRKREIRRHIAQGNAQLVIGTHALIEEKVEFDKIGLVIVDEQHRFGVMQRMKLMKKGAAEPDTLVMTATPIPRTLALTMYGDLDTSILDEMPPGRTPITTKRVKDEKAPEVWDFVRKQLKAKHQAYIVYPVIEAAEDDADVPAELRDESKKGRSKSGLKAAMHMYDELRAKVFPEFKVALLHGRLDPDEKDTTMRRFARGEIDVLVSTTVIEVGVDVPNANVMVIEHAERFGLSQLHQLRGRIGRGAAKSYCILMTSDPKGITEQGEERLSAMVRTQNGFEISELDLELRGPGEFFGTRQAGAPQFRVASLLRDRKLLEVAKREAQVVVANSDPEITAEERKVVMDHLRSHWQRRYGLIEVG
jgi:ATP-dependent DNA helicase RecG